MQQLRLEQQADYLDGAIVSSTVDAGRAIIHTGINALGARFVMVNDCYGHTVVTEGM